MALVLKDRVQEVTNTTGTGTLTLAGAVTGFQSFAAVGDGNTTYYAITGGSEWELGIGTYTASGTTLSRDTVLSSSNSGNLVDFAAGSKTVFVTYPAEKSVYQDASNNVSGYNIENSPIGGSTPAAGTFTTLTSNGETSFTIPGSMSVTSQATSGNNSFNFVTSATSGRQGIAVQDGTRFAEFFLMKSTQAGYGNTNEAVIRASVNTAGLRLVSDSSATPTIFFSTGTTPSAVSEQFRITNTVSAVNYVQVTGAATGSVPIISSQGSDTNVALFLTSKGTGAVQLATNNTERMRIDSSGNVGIGTSSPGAVLDVRSSSNAAIFRTSDGTAANNAGSWIYNTASGTAASRVANILLDGNGGDASGSDYFVLSHYGDNHVEIRNYSNGYMNFYTNNTERMRIDSSGNVLVGGTAARGTTVGAAHLDIFNGTAPAGTLTNGISLYSSSGDFLFMDSGGNAYKVGYRNLPAVGTKTGSYTLQTADVGKYVQLGSGGSITIPDATFAEGDAISIFNNTTGAITITCTITTAYIAGTDSDKASVSLATRGVATILFISSTVCVISGNVS
jgi:hypothetical protein